MENTNIIDIIRVKDITLLEKTMEQFSFIDLFAGIGGFRLGFEQAGFTCVYGCEIDKHCREMYKKNFGEYPDAEDMTKVNPNSVPKHYVLTAGFPCQPFSISGKQMGFQDSRGTLIYHVFKVIEKKRPKVLVLENVKHLIHHDKGRTLKTILDHLDKMGYFVNWRLLNASSFGVPQNRERVIIVGSKIGKFDFGKLRHKGTSRLKDVLDKTNKFEYLNEPYTLIKNLTIQKSGLIFVGYRNKKIRKAGVRPGTEHLSRVHKQPNRIYSSEGIHPTLPSQETSGRFWILDEGKVRKLTINECFKIMGFPSSFKKLSINGELYKQIGNSVCVPMITAIANEIKSQFLIKKKKNEQLQTIS